MSLYDCIEEGIKAGLIGEKNGREAQRHFRQQEAEYLKSHDAPTAAAMAARDTAELGKQNAVKIKSDALRSAAKLDEIEAKVLGHMDPHGKPDPAGGVAGLLFEAEHQTFRSVRSISDSYRVAAWRRMDELLQKHGRGALNVVRQRASLENVGRVLHGEKAPHDPAAEVLGKAVRDMNEWLRQVLNSKGADIGKLDDWGIPHIHDPHYVRKAGFEAWRADIAPGLNWDHIKNPATGRPFGAGASETETRAFLEAAFSNIISNGRATREPTLAPQRGGGLFGSHEKQRVLHFKDYDAWDAYNEKYGATNVYDAILRHVDNMAMDIALAEVLGPRPRAMLDYAIQIAQKKHFSDEAALKRIETVAYRARISLAQMDGSLGGPVNRWLAASMSIGRATVRTNFLGGALITSLFGDGWRVAHRAYKMGRNPIRPVMRAFAMAIGDMGTAQARQVGYIAETLAEANAADMRGLMNIYKTPVADWLSTMVYKWQGLQRWTDSARTVSRMEMAADFARNADRPLDQIDAGLKAFLQRKGVSAADWDAFRKDGLMTTDDGATFLQPDFFREKSSLSFEEKERIASSFGAIMEDEIEKTVFAHADEARAILGGGTRSGTLVGEGARIFGQFKNYPLTYVLLSWREIMAAQPGLDRAATVATIALGTMFVAGVPAMWMKDLLNGRDPRSMLDEDGDPDPRFFAAAFLQGGSAGILGDFLNAATSRSGHGLQTVMSGPSMGMAADAAALVLKPIQRAAKGEDPRVAGELVRFARKNNPTASLWWMKLIAARLIWDQAEIAFDPKSAREIRNRERQRLKDFGNEAYWPPGQALPSRAPDLSSAFGGASN